MNRTNWYYLRYLIRDRDLKITKIKLIKLIIKYILILHGHRPDKI